MQLMSGRMRGRVGTATRAASRPARAIVCVRAVAGEPSADRRAMLLAGGAAMVAPLLVASESAKAGEQNRVLPVSGLGSFQRGDQRNEFRIRAETVLKENLSPEDAAVARKLVFNDAGTYDAATKTGGMDGSIVLSNELNRAENAPLKSLVGKLRDVKQKIDALKAPGQQDISWADLLVLAAKAATQKEWAALKIKRAQLESGGEVIASTAFSAPWPVRLGRIDSSDEPSGHVPSADASVEEIRAYLLKLGTPPDYKPGPFTAKQPFWDRPGYLIWVETSLDPAAEAARWAAAAPQFADLRKKYDGSKRTLTRTDFEVDFIETFAKLTALGAKFDPDAYLYPVPLPDVKL